MQRFDEYYSDEMLYVFMSEQEAYLSRLFKVLSLMGDEYEAVSEKK